jgi:hypothetical protein
MRSDLRQQKGGRCILPSALAVRLNILGATVFTMGYMESP